MIFYTAFETKQAHSAAAAAQLKINIIISITQNVCVRESLVKVASYSCN